jgi:hypothetical protein
MNRWLERFRTWVRGAHLAVGAANRRALRFYRACGFRQMEQPCQPSAPLWFVINPVPAPDCEGLEMPVIPGRGRSLEPGT